MILFKIFSQAQANYLVNFLVVRQSIGENKFTSRWNAFSYYHESILNFQVFRNGNI